MTFFQKPLDHFHDSLCPTLTGMKVDQEDRASGFGKKEAAAASVMC
jgi:hypothetical protein